MKSKLCSRKFWMAAAAGLASIGASITGIATDNEILAGIGIACTAGSAAIYAAAEAYVDGKTAGATTTQTQIQASTIGADTNKVLAAVLPESKTAKAEEAKPEVAE